MDKDETIRILNAVLKELNMTANELALRLGIHRQIIYDVLNPNKNVGISKNLATKIIEHFPQFNPSFLLNGDGYMLSAGHVKHSQASAKEGALSCFLAATSRGCESVQAHALDAAFPITVSGDSMAPEYPGGSTIFIKRVKESAFIDYGKAYVLDTCNGRIIKTLMPPDDSSKKKVKCVSINPKYPSYDVGFENIYAIYMVIACISLK